MIFYGEYMDTEEKKEKMDKKSSNKLSFWKANRVLFAFLLLVILLIFTFCFVLFNPHLSNKHYKEDVSSLQTTTLFSIDKVVCYSSAYGISQDETQGRWNLNLGQYTDIAVYLNRNENVSRMYIDNISFEHSDIGNLSLSALDMQNFAKSPVPHLTKPNISSSKTSSINEQNSTINEAITNSTNLDNSIVNTEYSNSLNNHPTNSDIVKSESSNSILNNETGISIVDSEILNIQTPEKIEVSTTSPIFLRYLNHNFKEKQLISDIETPLTFDGSLLKRSKIILSSLKNTVSFTIHIINDTGNEFVFPISIPINLENKEEGQSIYDGNYTEELQFSNAYFYVK